MDNYDSFMKTSLNEQSAAFSQATTADVALAQLGLTNPPFNDTRQEKKWVKFRRALHERVERDLVAGRAIRQSEVHEVANACLAGDSYLIMRARQFQKRLSEAEDQGD